MARINLGSGQWFDPRASECFAEDTRWDGRNNISVATGSQWEHQELYRTRKGRWVLHSWSQWQGSVPRYSVVSDAEAKQWLIDQDQSPEDIERLFPGTLETAEV